MLSGGGGGGVEENKGQYIGFQEQHRPFAAKYVIFRFFRFFFSIGRGQKREIAHTKTQLALAFCWPEQPKRTALPV